MSADDFPYDVFLSHSAKDKVVRPLAERWRTSRAVAARRRRKDGLKVWPVAAKRPRVGGFDEWVLKPVDSIPAKIDPPSLRSFGETWEGLEPSCFGFRTSDFGFAEPGMSANAFGSDWAQLACPAVASVRRPRTGTFRFRAPLNFAFTPRLRRDKQARRFMPEFQPSAFILQPFPDALIQGSRAECLHANWQPENRGESNS